ncbi:MAG: PAS domain-containing protein [Rhodobacteraceae bacterium]|nr:PAS domain-containing protein [Paracoccaceae bacterium]
MVRQILEALPVAIVLVGPGERVLASNSAAAGLFGRNVDGRHGSALLRHPSFLNGLEDCLAGRTATDLRMTIPEKGGEIYLSVHIAPVPTGEGDGALVTFEDLTQQERTVAMRRDFVANVSHELRTPLTALVGFIDTLRGAARDDATARDKFLAIMEREAGRMIRLVNDLLSLSRVEAGERSRPSDIVEIVGLLKGAVAAHGVQAAEAGTTLELVAPEAPVTLRADADQLVQVMHNLIENAIKYGGKGNHVRIALSQLEREPTMQGPAIRIEVEDRGEGIDALHLPRLTERFYRVDSHRSREKGGTGLGLAIVKHIVNRHRGRLRIESEVGKGSKFVIILPETPPRTGST